MPRKAMPRTAVILLASAVLVAPMAAAAPSQAELAEQLKPFKVLLKGALENGLSGGTLSAMEACQLMAPALQTNLTSAVVEVGRASHRPRNPANTVQPWMQAGHQSYLDGSDTSPRRLELADGATGYIEPIYVQASCLQCHGTVLAPEVRDYLTAKYPADQATGFALGDYRGLFWLKSLPPKRPH